mgnify:CR=1 FL=1
MIATSPLAGSQYSYSTGTAGTVTVGAGLSVVAFTCYSAAGGTLTITPNGPNQTGSAGGAIVIPAGAPFSREWPLGGPLGPGTVLAFSGTDSYYVEFAKGGAGGVVP